MPTLGHVDDVRGERLATSLPAFRECEGCGRRFDRVVTGNDAGRFCSRGCAWLHRWMTHRIGEPERVIAIGSCRQCRVVFLREGKQTYCSRECSLKYYKKRYRELRAKQRSEAQTTQRMCLWCSKDYRVTTAHHWKTTDFCSAACAVEGRAKRVRPLLDVVKGRNDEEARQYVATVRAWRRLNQEISDAQQLRRRRADNHPADDRRHQVDAMGGDAPAP